MLLGKYSQMKDEAVHILISLIVSGIGYVFYGYGFVFFAICFFAGIAIDADHLLNSIIAKKLRLPSYVDTVRYGTNGYTIKIFHGFDAAFLVATAVFFLTRDFNFAFFLGINLCAHELWDFIVYPHSWRELFLATRWRTHFRPGIRKKAKNLIFDSATLKF